jgi:hypothetical protein
MNRVVSHLLLPALFSVLSFVVAFTPVELLGGGVVDYSRS